MAVGRPSRAASRRWYVDFVREPELCAWIPISRCSSAVSSAEAARWCKGVCLIVRSVLSVISVWIDGVFWCFALALEPARGSAERLRDMDANPASLPSRSVASICISAIFCKRSEGVGEASLAATTLTVECSRDLCSLGVSQLNWLLIQDDLDSAELRCISLPRGKSSSWPFPIGEDALFERSLSVR
jgi:hypothetical protein